MSSPYRHRRSPQHSPLIERPYSTAADAPPVPRVPTQFRPATPTRAPPPVPPAIRSPREPLPSFSFSAVEQTNTTDDIFASDGSKQKDPVAANEAIWNCCRCKNANVFRVYAGVHPLGLAKCHGTDCEHHPCEDCSFSGCTDSKTSQGLVKVKQFLPLTEPCVVIAVQGDIEGQELLYGLICDCCGLTWRALETRDVPHSQTNIQARDNKSPYLQAPSSAVASCSGPVATAGTQQKFKSIMPRSHLKKSQSLINVHARLGLGGRSASKETKDTDFVEVETRPPTAHQEFPGGRSAGFSKRYLGDPDNDEDDAPTMPTTQIVFSGIKCTCANITKAESCFCFQLVPTDGQEPRGTLYQGFSANVNNRAASSYNLGMRNPDGGKGSVYEKEHWNSCVDVWTRTDKSKPAERSESSVKSPHKQSARYVKEGGPEKASPSKIHMSPSKLMSAFKRKAKHVPAGGSKDDRKGKGKMDEKEDRSKGKGKGKDMEQGDDEENGGIQDKKQESITEPKEKDPELVAMGHDTPTLTTPTKKNKHPNPLRSSPVTDSDLH